MASLISRLSNFAVANLAVANLAVANFAVASLADAQSPANDRVAEGRVTRATADGRPLPVASQWVVLHRVGNDRSAPLDSMRTDANGRYRMRYRLTGDPGAIYFVSSRYSGIAYFSPPLRQQSVRGGDADILVYETTTDTSKLSFQGRHFVTSSPRANKREIAEIFEIENAGFRTVIAGDSTRPVISIVLPERAESASVGPGDLNVSSVAFRNGRAEVYSPISPGIRQLVLTYQLDTRSFPVSVPLDRPVSVLEVLLEEPRAIVQGARLAEVSPATVDRRMFRRFLAQDVPANAVMRVTAPPPTPQNQSAILMLVAIATLAMVVAFFVWLKVRRESVAAGALSMSPANVLIAQLATLDAQVADAPATPGGQLAHARKRAQLKERIARALAEGQTPG